VPAEYLASAVGRPARGHVARVDRQRRTGAARRQSRRAEWSGGSLLARVADEGSPCGFRARSWGHLCRSLFLVQRGWTHALAPRAKRVCSSRGLKTVSAMGVHARMPAQIRFLPCCRVRHLDLSSVKEIRARRQAGAGDALRAGAAESPAGPTRTIAWPDEIHLLAGSDATAQPIRPRDPGSNGAGYLKRGAAWRREDRVGLAAKFLRPPDPTG